MSAIYDQEATMITLSSISAARPLKFFQNPQPIPSQDLTDPKVLYNTKGKALKSIERELGKYIEDAFYYLLRRNAERNAERQNSSSQQVDGRASTGVTESLSSKYESQKQEAFNEAASKIKDSFKLLGR
jgi:hypothetical protein